MISYKKLVPIVSLTMAAVLARGGEVAWPQGQRHATDRLVGVWQNPAGSQLVYDADGTGKNPDGSRFRWRLESDDFIAQTLSPEGKAVGDPFRAPISFTRDGKEYTLSIEGGKRELIYHRLGPDRRVDEQRSPEGRTYVSGPKAAKWPAAKQGDEFAATPVYDDPPLPPARTGAVTVGPNVQVSLSRQDVPHWEVIVATDPADRGHLLAGSICNPPPIHYGRPKIASYVSFDGGKTWQPSLDRIGGETEVFADPDAAYGPDGSLYFANLFGPSLGSAQGAVEVSRSRDGGKSWGPATRIAGWRDRPFVAVDRTNGKFRGRLYCLTADGLFTSTDLGASFAPAVSLERKPGYIPIGSGNVVVLSDGRVVALYNGHLSEAGRASDPADRQPAYLAVRVSRDGGTTFGKEHVIAEGPIANLPPQVAVAPVDSPYADQLHVVWKSDLADACSRVLWARLTDGGTTWERPQVLSEQPNDSADGKVKRILHSAYLPAVAVNKQGVVGVSWYDTRGLPVKQAGYMIRFRALTDGGTTWLPSVRVSTPTLWTASVKRRYAQPEEEEGYWKSGPGHTAGLAADADGGFHPVWIDGRTGVRQVYSATVAVLP